ncbi:hypothetical protein [Hugenholtzia roseola]|uniref:hypothetical protein n=1 Tax=Hugenholtzia roseola TaxID=1002 RepID=UPI000426640D|nr:hypothetical protein [Hugenholtzia roseola]
MKFRLIALLICVLAFFSFESCIHAPRQAWTPKNDKVKLARSKPKNPKEEKKIHHVKAW